MILFFLPIKMIKAAESGRDVFSPEWVALKIIVV